MARAILIEQFGGPEVLKLVDIPVGEPAPGEIRTLVGIAEPEVRVEEWVEDGRRVIRADIPGVDPEKDIELTVDGNVLHLRGERREEEHSERRSEIRYGSFERLITLPRGTSPDDVSATYADGVLTVSMPAAAPAAHAETPVAEAH